LLLEYQVAVDRPHHDELAVHRDRPVDRAAHDEAPLLCDRCRPVQRTPDKRLAGAKQAIVASRGSRDPTTIVTAKKIADALEVPLAILVNDV